MAHQNHRMEQIRVEAQAEANYLYNFREVKKLIEKMEKEKKNDTR